MDWDLHHGDGTQSIFAYDPTVFCISIHSIFDLYMAKQAGMHSGTTTAGEDVGQCNIPVLNAHLGDEMVEKLNLPGQFYDGQGAIRALEETLAHLPFPPDCIFIFSGYDSHQEDQGEDIMDWQDADYQYMTRLLVALAQQHHCPLLSVHGGAYTFDVTIRAVLAHVAALAAG